MRAMLWIVVLGVALSVPLSAGQDLEGGGTIHNVLPVVSVLTNAEGAMVPKNGADVISGSALDKNGEVDIASISLTISFGDSSVQAVFDAFGSVGATRPDEASDKWRVWNSGGRDGVYQFEYEYTYTTVGDYTIEVAVTDAVGIGAVSSLAVSVLEFIEALAEPVEADGTISAGRWGGWQTVPGATNVESNFLRVVNNGDEAQQAFSVSFADAAFVGADGVDEIRILLNVQFRCAQTSADEPAVPSAVFQDVAWVDELAGGSSCTFSSTDALMYVQYRIQSVPMPLKAQDYETGFIVQADN